MNLFWFFIFLVFFVVPVGGLIFVVSRTFLAAWRSKSWPTVQGVIMISEVTKLKRDYRSFANNYREKLQYEYQVDGNSYSSNIISLTDSAVLWFGSGGRSRSVASRIVQNYPVGKLIIVHYDPPNPNLAVLETGVFSINFILMTLIVLVMSSFFLIAIWAFVSLALA